MTADANPYFHDGPRNRQNQGFRSSRIAPDHTPNLQKSPRDRWCYLWPHSVSTSKLWAAKAKANGGPLSNSAFCLSRLLRKNTQKIGNLLPDVGRILGQHQVGLCGQFRPAISIANGETCGPTIVRRRIVTKRGHVDSRFQIPGDTAPCCFEAEPLPIGRYSRVLRNLSESEVKLPQRSAVFPVSLKAAR